MRRLTSVFIIFTILIGFSLIAPASVGASTLIISTSNESVWDWEWDGKGGGPGANYRLIWSEKTAESFLAGVHTDVKEELQARLEKVDFDKQVAIVAYMGEMPTAGYQVEIAQIAVMDQTVLIDVGMRQPAEGVVAQVRSYPYDVVTLPRTDIPAGEIRYRMVNQNGQVLGDRLTTVNAAVKDTAAKDGNALPQKPSVAKDAWYTVKTGDTLWALAQKFKTTIETLLKLNPEIKMDEIYVGQRIKVKGAVLLPAPVAKDGIHVVQTGESLWTIAKQYDTTIEKLMEWNKLTDDAIWAGQQLRVKA
ncbi:MAG TPA: LysM peptidoglycan-binding domain-containing protein [Firmicutes bacterium]|jgi:LysM repeat protein|nr:LysM peptidoglycan-binding domain-containing protein [Bacillota bacterium]